MSSKRRIRKIELGGEKACAFCGMGKDNEVLFGKYIISDTICVHANCLYFASGLRQQGNESDGFLGFLLQDIEAELHRGRKLFCSYCKKRGATVGCCSKACRKSFHLNCGIEHGSLHQFYGSFPSYCKDHKPKQKPLRIADDFYCFICCESIKLDEVESCLYSPCCKQNFFHKMCLQTYAFNAGKYFFKCPLCNNSSDFIKEMKKHGINVPEKDASWELEENAYQELLVKPECDAHICLCPRGRKYRSQRKSGWTLLTCSYCGFHARHKKCENMKLGVKRWLCKECKSIDSKIIIRKASSQIIEKSASGKNGVKNFLPEIMCNPFTNNLDLSPKIDQENCLVVKNSLHCDINCDTVSNSWLPYNDFSHGTKAFRSNVSSTKPTESTDASENVKFDHVLNGNAIQMSDIKKRFNYVGKSRSSQAAFKVVAPSNYKLNNKEKIISRISLPVGLPKLRDKATNLKNIKNIAHNSQVKRLKNISERRVRPYRG